MAEGAKEGGDKESFTSKKKEAGEGKKAGCGG